MNETHERNALIYLITLIAETFHTLRATYTLLNTIKNS